jgi:GGDEF domain-containing protein
MGAAVVSPQTSDFVTVVRQRSWEWLAAFQRRLNVDRLQIVDERGSPLIPETGASSAAMATAMARMPEVTSAISQAIHSKSPQTLRVGQIQLTCVGLPASDGHGALLLARTVTEATASEAKSELELIGSWLRPAIEAHIGSAREDSTAHAPRVSALFRVLSGAGTSTNESALLRLYANALAIWHDIELNAYVEDVDGDFRLVVALPGSPAADASKTLAGDEVAIGSELTRVSGHDLEVLGLRANEEAMAARVGDVKHGTVWLLVLSGGVDSVGESGLSLYTDVLRQALQSVAAASLLSVERTIWQHLVNTSDEAPTAALAALREVENAVDATRAALSVTSSQSPGVQVGELSLLSDSDGGPGRLVATTRLDDRATVTLAVQNPRNNFFSSRDRQVVETLGRLFGSWAGGALLRASTASDRRAASRSFEDLLEQAAAHAAARGTSSSVVVIQVSDTGFPMTYKVAADLRPHLRAGEAVGVLGLGEIGLLLYDSKPEVARLVFGRLQHAVADTNGGGPLASAIIGVAHCTHGSGTANRLVRAAREDARASRSLVNGARS